MGLFGKHRAAADHARTVSPEDEAWLLAHHERTMQPGHGPTYWVRRPGESDWETYTLLGAETYEDLLRCRPGAEIVNADPPS